MYEESAVIRLIPQTETKDRDGIPRKTEGVPRTVFCKVRSASASEVFEGGRNGLNPAYTFKIYREEYAGETIVEYEGQRYAVYRTFVPDKDRIELHTESKAGAERSRT